MSTPADDIQHQVIAALLADPNVAALAAKRVYPNVMPDSVIPGQLTVLVNLIDGQGEQTLGGYTGKQTSTVQVDSYGETKTAVNALSKACKLRLQNHGGHFGDAIISRAKIRNELDGPSEAPIDKSDRWRYRRILRCEIDYCGDLT